MRKALFLLLAAAAMLFCACTAAPDTAEPANEIMQAPSWQAQYDLGVRYLSEGNYEEAIIAFTAAIEIEPKQAELYLYRARAYNAIGDSNAQIDYETALLLDDTLVEAYRALIWIYREAEEYDKLADLLERARAATGDPYFDTLNQFGYEKFEFRSGYVSPEELTDDQRNAIECVLNAAEAGDAEAMIAAILSSEFFYPCESNFSSLCTFWNEEKISIYTTVQDDTSVYPEYGIIHGVRVQVRPENGAGYYYSADTGDNGYLEYQQATCACIDWQWNGAMHATKYWCRPQTSVNGLYYTYYDAVADGTLENSLLEGEFISVENITYSDFPGLVTKSTIARQFTRGVSNQYDYKLESNLAEIVPGAEDDNVERIENGTVTKGSIDFIYAHISNGNPGFFW